MAGGKLLRAGAAIAALVALSFGLGAPAPAAETWPTRPIKLINALAAGSAPDILSRMIAEPLSRALGQQVVVENRAGAANIIATQAAARAAPDGYTLYFGPSLALAVNPHTFKSLPYDPVTDFTYIAMVSKAAFFVLAHPDLPAKSLPELIALDKAKPGQLSVAVDGPKNSSGMLAAWLNKTAGLGMVLVPYATMPQGIQDALAGRVQLTVAAGLIAAPHIDRGALRPLAVSSANRIPGLSERADHRRDVSGLRVRRLVRAGRAQGHAGRRSSRGSTRRWTRSCATPSWSGGWASSASTSTARSPRRRPPISCAASATPGARSCAPPASRRSERR